MTRLLLILFFVPVFSSAQTVNYRKYKAGEIYRYKLTSESYRNDQPSGKTISISEHKVIADAGFLWEEIKWLSKSSYTTSDTTNLDSIARGVIPYRISLDPKGNVLLPALSIPEMVGDITDLNTFWVAVSPEMHVQDLSLKDSVFVNKKTAEGNFGDGQRILKGTDCITVTQHLLNTGRKTTVIRTDFLPPTSFCLTPLLDTVAKKTFELPNNFQMIQKGAGDKVNFLWGVESFIITTKIDNKTGQIIEATMDNILSLRMRYNSSKDLQAYDAEFPVLIKRHLKLELLKNKKGS